MILKWANTYFKPEEQLLGILFDGGIMTKEQVMVVAGFSQQRFKYCLERARNLRGDSLVQSLSLPRSLGRETAYALTKFGMRYVYEMLGYEMQRVQVAPEGQLIHYLGTNNVLVRAINRFGREQVEWLSTRELAEELDLMRRIHNRNTNYRGRGAIRPDAAIRIKDANSAWIEFDNNTESTAKLEQKFNAYWRLSEEISNSMRPIIWVTATTHRRDYLERVYKAMAQIHGWDQGMHHLFCLEGNDTKWLGKADGL